MRGSSLGYLLKEGAKNIYNNRLMSAASIGVLMACLLLIGGSVLISLNVNSIIGYMEDQNEVVVFLDDGLDQTAINDLGAKIKENENVLAVKFVSKEEALLEVAQQNGVEPDDLIQDGEESYLPDSFRVQVDDLSRLAVTVGTLQTLDHVDYVNAATEVATIMTDIKTGIYFAGLFVITVLGIVSMVIVANTIKMTIFARRKEISIMKYVGATNIFIRLPFIIEGILLGLISALLAFGLLWIGYHFGMQWLETAPSSWLQTVFDSFIRFQDVALLILGGFVAAGTIIGMMGSILFVGKYLKA